MPAISADTSPRAAFTGLLPEQNCQFASRSPAQMRGTSGHASITVDDLLVLPAPAARRGLTRGNDAGGRRHRPGAR